MKKKDIIKIVKRLINEKEIIKLSNLSTCNITLKLLVDFADIRNFVYDTLGNNFISLSYSYKTDFISIDILID